MRRYLTLLAALAIVATTLAVALVVVAPAAQVERAPLTGKANPTLVGLLVFSSKGHALHALWGAEGMLLAGAAQYARSKGYEGQPAAGKAGPHQQARTVRTSLLVAWLS